MKSLGLSLLQIALVAFGASSLVACAQDTVDSSSIAGTSGQTNNIDRSYTLTYDEQTSSLGFLGSFRMANTWNTTVRLAAPSTLAVNGRAVSDSQAMSKETATSAGVFFPLLSPFFWAASGTYYVMNLGSRDPNSLQTIEWVDQLGQHFSDQLRIYPITQVIAAPSLSTSSSYSVQVAATSAPGRDNYTAKLNQKKADGTYVSAVETSSNGAAISFAPADLAKFESGSAELSVERSVDVNFNSTGSGRATGSMVYKTRTQNIRVN